MTYEDIKKANEQLKAIDVKGKDYVDVAQRVQAFRSVCPDGSIETDILFCENGVVTMRATVRNEAGKILATGFAQEKETSSYINKTSYIENCETSAVGRALGMCGFGSTGSICSLEELANAINNQGEKTESPLEAAISKAKARGEKTEEKPPVPSEPSSTYDRALALVYKGKSMAEWYREKNQAVLNDMRTNSPADVMSAMIIIDRHIEQYRNARMK